MFVLSDYLSIVFQTKDKRIRKRWELIEETLLKPMRTSRDFQVLTYCVKIQ